jgi:hypothetical protein
MASMKIWLEVVVPFAGNESFSNKQQEVHF